MIAGPLLLDTGPIVAILHETDEHHQLCRELTKEVQGSMITTWAVVTEAAYLLGQRIGGNAIDKLFDFLASEAVHVFHIDEKKGNGFFKTVSHQYRDLKPQVADLSLLYLAREFDIDTVFKLDRRDFTVYRTSDGKPFRLEPDNA